jgi:RNA binding exosome subunit
MSNTATENHLRNEIDILNKETQHKDATIKKLESLIEKLQEDAVTRRQALDVQVRDFMQVDAPSRSIVG